MKDFLEKIGPEGYGFRNLLFFLLIYIVGQFFAAVIDGGWSAI